MGACVTHSHICGARLMVGTQMCSTYHFNLLGCIIRCRVGPKILPCAQEHSSYQFGTELSFAKTRSVFLYFGSFGLPLCQKYPENLDVRFWGFFCPNGWS